jgi:hypothetical protein
MNRWTAFLNSLNSAGGNLIVLVVLFIGLAIGDVALAIRHPEMPASATYAGLAKDAFVALIAILRAPSNNTPPPSGGTTSTTTTSTEVKA